MKPKQNKAARMAELQRKLFEAEAMWIHHYHFLDAELDKISTDRMMGSGVIITLQLLGGRKIGEPTMIRNGLSPETIAALRKDLARSFEYATELKPRGVS